MTYTIIRSDGTSIELTQEQYDLQFPAPPKTSAPNILAAPKQGFGGPTAKELFHGNR